MELIMIVAVSENWGIGRDGKLLFSLPEDMKYFKEKTMGSAVIMGRTTLESFPGAKPLAGRENIILSSDKELKIEGALVVHDLKELFEKIKSLGNKAYVIGGASIYKQLEPYCEQALITKVSAKPEADRFFPNLDLMPDWELESESDEHMHEGLAFRFVVYKNKNVRKNLD